MKKIDIFIEYTTDQYRKYTYIASTMTVKTCKEAVNKFKASYPYYANKPVKAFFDKLACIID
jgi:hypothetical protein